MRYNMPFGAVGTREFGTYFIGYAASPMSSSRCSPTCSSGTRPGTYDRILDFSTALTGNLFFVPTLAFLDDPPEPGRSSEPSAPGTASDGSLGIGSLSGQPRGT